MSNQIHQFKYTFQILGLKFEKYYNFFCYTEKNQSRFVCILANENKQFKETK